MQDQMGKGCVPVILSDEFEMPFQDLLPLACVVQVRWVKQSWEPRYLGARGVSCLLRQLDCTRD